MGKEQILTIILSIATSLLGSSVLTSLFNRRWERANKSSNILEEQYLKVISPIYRELQLKNHSKKEMILNIENIIYENFHLLPEQLLEKFKNFTKNEREFRKLIFDFYVLLRNELGYSKIKISKDIRDKEKLLAHKRYNPPIDRLHHIFISIAVPLLLTMLIEFLITTLIKKPFSKNDFMMAILIIVYIIMLLDIAIRSLKKSFKR